MCTPRAWPTTGGPAPLAPVQKRCMPALIAGPAASAIRRGRQASPRRIIERARDHATAGHEPAPLEFLLVVDLGVELVLGTAPRHRHRSQRDARLGGRG